MTAPAVEWAAKAAAEMIGDRVQLRLTQAGAPLAVRWNDQVWQVADEPEHWNAWRILGDCAAAPEPHTTDTQQTEYWRMQLHCHGSEPDVMVVLVHNPASDGWRVQRISEC